MIEDAIQAAVAAAVAPLASEMRGLRDEIATMRRALPAPTSTIEEYARLKGISTRTVRRAVKAGTLPVQRIGRRVLVDLSARPASTDEIAAVASAARREA